MTKFLGLCTFLCASLALNASPFTDQETHKLKHDIQLLQDTADGIHDLQFSDYFLHSLRQKHRIFSQYYADPDVSEDDKLKVKALYQSLNETLSLYLTDIKLLDFTEPSSERGQSQAVIAGYIIDSQSQEPLVNSYVALYNNQGLFAEYTRTDNIGRYAFTNLSAGEYFVRSGGFNNYVQQFSDGVICPGGIGQGCEINDLTPITLSANEIKQGIDLSLIQSGIIKGQVNTQSTIELYDEFAELITSVSSEYYGGNYTINVPPNLNGNFYIKYSSTDYFSQLYNDVLCQPGCDVTNGTPIQVSPYETVVLDNVQLQNYSRISGSLSYNNVHDIGSQRVRTYVLDQNGDIVSSTYIYSDQDSWHSPPLPDGQYQAFINSSGYISQFFNNKNCIDYDPNDCLMVSPDTIHHSASIDTEQINFSLDQKSTIQGHIFDQQGMPVNYSSIDVYDIEGNKLYDRVHRSQNHYIIFGLSAGQYYITAHNSSHLTSFYPDIVCQDTDHYGNCNDTPPAQAILTVSGNNHLLNKDITLTKGASITALVKDTQQQPLNGKTFVLLDHNHQFIKEFHTYNQTEITFLNLPLGEYYVGVRDKDPHSAGYYNGLICDSYYNCPKHSATKITLSTYSNYGPYQVTVQEKGAINFNIISNKDGTSVTQGTIEIYNSNGLKVDYGSPSSTIYLSSGIYYAIFKQSSAYSGDWFVNKVYGAGNCPEQCNPFSGTPIYVPQQGTVDVTMNLDAYFKISGTVAFQDINNYADRSTIKIYRSNQISDSATTYSSSYAFYLTGSEPLKIAAENSNYYRQVYNNVNCLGADCGLGQATVIHPALNTERVVDFNLQPMNRLSGQITDKNNQPLIDFPVRLRKRHSYRDTTTDSFGRYTFTAIYPGEYNVSTRPMDQYFATRHTGEACEDYCAYDEQVSITVPATGQVNNINISPVKKGGIQVKNLRFQDGQSAYNLTVTIYNFENNEYINFDRTSSVGDTEVMYIPTGNYYITASSNSSYSYLPRSMYPNINCRNKSLNDCAQLATIITLTDDSVIILDDFVIHEPGKLAVTLRDADTQSFIDETRNYAFYDSDMNLVTRKSISPDNSITLPPGDFYLMAEPNSSSHYSAQLFPDVICPRGIGLDCIVSQGQTFTVSDNQQSNVVFQLNKKPTLQLTAVDSYSLQPISSRIKIYKDLTEGYVHSNDYQTHHTLYLDPGEYYARIDPQYNSFYPSILYPDVICEFYDNDDCDHFAAQSFEVTSTGQVPVTVEMPLLKGIQGQLVNGVTQLPIESGTIDFWATYGRHEFAVMTSENGYFSAPLSGNYYLSTDIPQNLTVYNEVYNNRHCFDGSAYWDLCDLRGGEVIKINNETPLRKDIMIVLDGDAIFNNSFENITP